MYTSIFQKRLKIQFRIKGYYALIPVILFLLFGSTYGIPETFLSLTGYVTQSLLFLGMLLGYHGGLRDKKQAGEYLFTLRHSYEGQVFSLLSEWCFAVFLHIFLYAYIWGSGLLYRQEAWYYKETFFYAVLYYLLPMLLGDAIGRVCSVFGGNPVWYFVLVLTGFCIGPMAHPFLEMLCGHFLGEKAGKGIADFLNIGQTDIGYGMDFFYGLQIESKRYAHILFFLFAVLAVWSLLLRRQLKNGEGKGRGSLLPILFSMAAVVSLAVYVTPSYLPSSEDSFNDFAINQYDWNFYSEKTMTDRAGIFRIDRISGTVDTGRYLSFSGTIGGEVISDADTLSFRLYHDLRVEELSGEGISGFEQDGDTVKILLEKEEKSGALVSFYLHYEGASSPYFYANERAVFLPAYFNWLPCPGEGNAMRLVIKERGGKTLYPVPVFIKNEVMYDLVYIGTYEAYSNLMEDADGHFRGVSAEGVYLFSNGHMRTYSYGDGEIVSCIPMSDEFAREAGSFLAEQVGRLQEGAGRLEEDVQKDKSAGEEEEDIQKDKGAGQQKEGRLQEAWMSGKPYRILLVPHHVSGNTASFEYADAGIIYADAETWNVIQGYSQESREEALKKSAEYAVRQFETNPAGAREE